MTEISFDMKFSDLKTNVFRNVEHSYRNGFSKEQSFSKQIRWQIELMDKILQQLHRDENVHKCVITVKD